MKRTAAVITTLVIAATAAWLEPAAAGGSPIEFDKYAYVSGETATASGAFGTGCCGRGDPDDGPYFLYILQRKDYSGIPPVPEDAILVDEGEISFRNDAGGGYIEWTFTVPDLAPGEYWTLHCNEPCTKQLGDLVHTALTIVETPGDARILAKLRRLENVHRSLAHESWVAHVIDAVRERINRRARNVEARLKARIEELETRAGATERMLKEERENDPGELSLLAGGVALIFMTGLIARRRKP